MFTLSCGGTPPGAGGEGKSAEVRQALDSCSGTDVDSSQCEIQLISKAASAISTVYSGAKTAVDLLQVLGIISSPPSQQELFTNLDQHLARIGVSLSSEATAASRNVYLPNAIANAETTRQLALMGLQVDFASDLNRDSRADAIAAEAEIAFQRMYTGQPTDLGSTHVSQSAFIPPRDTAEASPPPAQPGDLIYDWRLGVPYLMELIAFRIAVLSSADPNWGTTDLVTLGFDTEMREYRDALVGHFNRMRQGIKCGMANASKICSSHAVSPEVWCQDIYTGYHLHQFTSCSSSVGMADIRADLIHQIEATMPLFDIRKMIDVLYLYANPGPDLSESWQQIDLESDTSLCLEVPWDSTGTLTRVNTCDWSNGQWWMYDRKTSTIRNPWANKCLDVQWGNWRSGTPVWLWDCSAPEVDNWAQKWTWDPERKRLHSAVNAEVVVEGALAPQGSVMMTNDSFNPEFNSAQAWHAD
jgi:hypothetical protein